MAINKHSSIIEEIASSITHGLGLLLAIIGIFFLILINIEDGDFLRIFGLGIFGLSVILTFTFSTLYHSLYFTKANNVFKRLDHSSIFLLISGTYTPFILISLKNQLGLILLLFLWLTVVLGIVYKSIFINYLKRLQLLIFILMGWIGLIIFKPMLDVAPAVVIWLLILGGSFYTLGTIFYAWRGLKFNHSIWHLFVLLGTTCHIFALFYL